MRGARGPRGGRASLGGTFAALVVAVGCAGRSGKTDDAPSRATDVAPHPQGVAIDPMLELPAPVPSADPAGGIAVLAEPVDPEPARRVVKEFFDAVAAESIARLDRVLMSGAHVRTGTRPPRPEPALPNFRRRFELLDYTALGGEAVYRRTDVETYVSGEGIPARAKTLPTVPRGTDVVVRVTVSGQAASKLLGPELTFVVRKAGPSSREGQASDERAGALTASPGAQVGQGAPGDYKIAELFEDFRLP